MLHHGTSAINFTQKEEKGDSAALIFKRSIQHIEVDGQPKACLVVPAVADGDCGFTASRLCLTLQGREDLVSHFYRQAFIDLIKKIEQNASQYEEFKSDILNLLKGDGAKNLTEWENKFKSSGYWLEEPHFVLLSKIFNIRFNFYYLPPDEAVFKPELGYETIFHGEDDSTAVTISLAHVSTGLKDKLDPGLNHFDGILIEPTQKQKQKIARFIESGNEKTLAAQYQEASSFLPSLSFLPEKERQLAKRQTRYFFSSTKAGYEAVKFLITNYDELNNAVESIIENQVLNFTDDSDKLLIKVHSDKLKSCLQHFLDKKKASSLIHVCAVQSNKIDDRDQFFTLDAWLLLYASTIPDEKAIPFINMLSEKYESLSSITAKQLMGYGNVLMQAVYGNRLKIVKLLMKKDPTLYETRDRWGNNPLLLASIYGYIDIICYFLKNCQKTPFVESEVDNLNPLFCAIYGDSKETVKFWLDNYPELYNHKSRLGDAPISLARRYGRLEIAKYLEKCIAQPNLSLEKICSSSCSWMDCEKAYFLPNNSNFRNYWLANVKDKWGRNAIHILMSSIAIILSSPQLVFDEQSKDYRNIIERAANQLKKIELFVKYKVNINERDDAGKQPMTSFLLGLSKRQDETPFGWDAKSNQNPDKGKFHRNNLANYVQSLLQFAPVEDWKAIKEQYEAQRGQERDLLLLLAKWYPELGKSLPKLVSYCREEQGAVRSLEPEVVQKKDVSYKIAFTELLSNNMAVHELRKLWSLLESSINIFCGANASGKTLLLKALENYANQLNKKTTSLSKSGNLVQKILNKEDIENAEIVFLDEPDAHLYLGNIKTFIDNLREYYKGIKIIIVTHRIETIALCSKNIFYVERDISDRVVISSCHPKLARLRMTKGLREVKEIGAHIPISVYAEALDDVNFYQKIYQLLHANRGMLENIQISDRYRPNFSCVSLGGGHGSQAVRKAMALHNASSEEGLITQPFAILDDDSNLSHSKELLTQYTLEKAFSKLRIDDLNIIFTKRRSMENYLYDPFLVCSVLSLGKIKMIGNQSIRSCLMNCKLLMDSYFKESKNLEGAQENLIKEIQKNVKTYCSLVCNLPLDAEESSQSSLQQVNDSKDMLVTLSYVGESQKLKCMYPRAFLRMRGHDIEKAFNSIDTTEQGLSKVRQEAKLFKPTLLKHIQSSNNICISNDLLEIFVELNRKIKLQINKIIKPNKYEKMISEEQKRSGRLAY